MPNATAIHEALGILLKHSKDPYMSAEHDEVFLPGPPPEKLPADDVKRLAELGVTWDDGLDSWHCFV